MLTWNQILTCVSFSLSMAAISARRVLFRYLLVWNSFSSSVSWWLEKLVRLVLLESSTGFRCFVTASGALPRRVVSPPGGGGDCRGGGAQRSEAMIYDSLQRL